MIVVARKVYEDDILALRNSGLRSGLKMNEGKVARHPGYDLGLTIAHHFHVILTLPPPHLVASTPYVVCLSCEV